MTVAAWLDSEAPRVLLATLTDRDDAVERVASETWISAATLPAGIIASGGTESIESIGGTQYKIHRFTTDGTFTVTNAGDADYLVVAGGGGGGGGDNVTTGGGGGGGGAGGIETGSNSFTASSFVVTVGSGGAGGGQKNYGSDGVDSVIAGVVTADGGGGGAGSTGTTGLVGNAGGSGGGGAGAGGTSSNGAGGAATATIGFAGGIGIGQGGGGGGGGAGSVGASGSGDSGGAGGSGYDASAFGLDTIAGGGGGGRGGSGSAGTASNGGGAGGNTGEDGVANTGGGGGGMSADQTLGGTGGSGVVVIKYPYVPTVPANTVFDGRIIDADVEWRMGGALGRSGAANGGDLVLANPDGELDDWLSREWVSIQYLFGHPDWAFGDFITIFESRIDSVEANDETISFSLRDRYVELGNPIQTVTPVPAPSAALLYPLCYGWPKNITPIITEPNAAPEYRIGEPPCEDSATTRYKNQASFTSPGIAKSNASAQFDLDSDPNARVTVDAKGKLNGSSVWIENLGETLQDALTRTHANETGILEGGSSTTVVLPDSSSSVDDFYNGDSIRKWVAADAAVGDHTTAETRTITDYVGSTRTATMSAWTTAAAAGDVYRIAGVTVQAGPLTTADLDTDAFTQFDTDYPYSIGLFIDDGSMTAAQMLDMALTPGAYHTWTTGGDGVSKLTIGILKDPSAETADFSLGEGDVHGDVERVQEVAITRKLRVGFLKNHTVSTESHDASATRAGFVEEEFRWVAKGSFRPELDPDEASRDVETLIIDSADAYTELDRLWALMSVRRQIYIVQTLLKPLSYGLGSVVAVTDDRHELSGKKLVVVGMTLFPLEDRIELELWG